MISAYEVKQRALMMAIKTGDRPHVELIWDMQKGEGHATCFGQGMHCSERQCRWRNQCLALDFYADLHLPISGGEELETVRKPEKREVAKVRLSEHCSILEKTLRQLRGQGDTSETTATEATTHAASHAG